ncbi:hypothetical protein MLD38_008054 [Melastoma candidum]|uniref:Uncharacterized protein n=1 Tax=Melastoma candidum TaxID=119954 RepID=A0ACB9RT95_9MYRT|nr:hypothetical protein MLD38_008054 [Melastoma candidum]
MAITIDRALLLALLLLLTPAGSRSEDCVYTVYVRTGSIWKGGTDASIGLTVYDGYDEMAEMRNLVAWGGLMEPGHSYFERGNLDIFSGRGPCLAAPVCAINITSDGSGENHGWYCNYVEVTSTGPHVSCAQKLFKVEQWLAVDAPPYTLSAYRNDCPKVDVGTRPSGSPAGGTSGYSAAE